MKKTYHVRLYPTLVQERELVKLAGASRFVWNYFLEKRIGFYQANHKTLSCAVMSRDLTKLRHELGWMGVLNADIAGASLRNLDKTYGRFLKRKRGFPRFKTKKNESQSFQKRKCWSVVGNRIRITKNLYVRFRGSLDASIPKKTVVITRSASGKWYLSAFYDAKVHAPKRFTKPIGIDLGVKHLAITSDGHKYAAVPEVQGIKRLQRIIARKKNGSINRAKAKVALAKMYERIANIRKDHTHKISHAITSKNHAVIVCEDLNVAGMVKNHNLARAISNANWSELVRQLEYKQLQNGAKLVKVDRFFPSSKTCSACGFLRKELPLNIREWNCPNCGAKLDRDINAAKNILAEGLRNNPAWRTWVRRSAKVSQPFR